MGRRKIRKQRQTRDRHHIPPQSVDPDAPYIWVNKKKHRAYHMLFGNAASLDECIEILKRDWWPENLKNEKGV